MIAKTEYKKILIIRNDRLGDCILSTPAAEAIKKIYPAASIDILTTQYTKDVFTDNPFISEVLIDDSIDRLIFSAKFISLVSKVKSKKYDAAFILHMNARAALIPFLAGIPARTAPASKVYQFLANRRIHQKRSACLMNEAEYNLELIKSSCGINFENPPARLFFSKSDEEIARHELNLAAESAYSETLEEMKINNKRLVMVHPGSGGSALNMKKENYVKLIELLNDSGYRVFLSTGPAENNLKNDILSQLSFKPISFEPSIFVKTPSLKKTFALISLCDAVIAPSTGVMHAASALNKPVVTLFCPIFVCTPKRWGPYMAQKCSIIKPEFMTDEKSNMAGGQYCKRCLREKCPHFNCMDKISEKLILSEMKNLLK